MVVVPGLGLFNRIWMVATDTGTVLRDTASIAGVDTPSRILAVSATGKVVFKQNQRAFFLYDEQRAIHSIAMPELFGRYEKLQVFDALFIDNVALAIVFQNGPNGEYCITRAVIDIEKRTMVLGEIHETGIKNDSHKRVILTRDEKGAILLTHTIGISAGEITTVELFHISNFFRAGGKGSKLAVSTKPSTSDGVFTSAFVSRNMLYLFFSLDYSKCLVTPLTGQTCGRSEIRTTKGQPPPIDYMVKTLEVFDDFLIVYSTLSSNKDHQPVMHLLDLTYLRWQRLHLQLSDHAPAGNISLRASSHDADWAWLHGNCNRPNCAQRTHLYQIDVSHLEYTCRSRSSSLSSLLIASASSSSLPCYAPPPLAPPSTSSSETPPTHRAEPPVVSRFKKKTKATPRSHSFSAVQDEMCDASVVAAGQRRDRPPSVHWAEDMDGAAEFELKDQIKRAKEMGYTDEAVYEALRRNTRSGDLLYTRFADMNSMLDLLNKTNPEDKSELSSSCSPSCTDRSSLSGRNGSSLSLDQRPQMKMSVYRDHGSPRTNRSFDSPRSASVSRSSSFHIDTASRKMSQAPTNDISRLLVTLDKENERNRKTQMEQIELLMQKVEDMKVEQAELNQKLDKETLDKLHLQHDLQNQKDLEKYRTDELRANIDRLQQELEAACEERDQMRAEMQEHMHKETELMGVIEEKENTIKEMCENMETRSTVNGQRLSGFFPHCIICLERWPNIVFLKCMHLALCEECYDLASNSASNPLKNCPNCREPISGSLKVFT